ncbi:tripartite ATP-independent periplasmic transporter [Afipia carboxidovorans OM5]|nr:tripartite ATP-independent periplasmic transporter [Afipia carboxidovorans OM5]
MTGSWPTEIVVLHGGPVCGRVYLWGLNLQALLKLSRGIDAMTTTIGRWLSWLILIAVIISSANATIRKIFDVSSNAYLELQWMLFGAVFLLCSPWTLLKDEHIKIDIVNHHLPLKVRSWIDLIGHVFFLMPFCIVVLWTSIPFFLVSYHQNEQSFNAGGLPQWPAKSLVVLGAALLLVQAISEIIKRVAVMQGLLPDPNKLALSAHEQAALEAERLAEAISSETK